jgi:CRISPR-associated protein Cas1
MTERVIEIANPARLHVRDAQLVIEPETGAVATAPVSEVGVLLISNPRVTMTQAVLSRIALEGGAVITCDEKFLPASLLLPVQAHYLQTERFAKQIETSSPARKRYWRTIVRAKIRAQGKLLRRLHGSDGGLLPMAARVRSGDVENLEAQAARRYWGLIFGDAKFRRGNDAQNQNRHLDYGYIVLRAATARALCAAGLHPSLGVQHHNRYDSFSLASDMMEPFRPIIDERVFCWIQEHDPCAPLDRETRGDLLGALTARYLVKGEERSLFDLLLRTANGLARSICGEEAAFDPPDEFLLCGE